MICSTSQVSGVVEGVVSEAKLDLLGDLEVALPFVETIPTLNPF